jgi:tRNA(Phe) wybutosine-synthesizing methylase Tyw3
MLSNYRSQSSCNSCIRVINSGKAIWKKHQSKCIPIGKNTIQLHDVENNLHITNSDVIRTNPIVTVGWL